MYTSKLLFAGFFYQLLAVLLCVGLPVKDAYAQAGAAGGEWHFYGGDSGGTKYTALDQIHATNVKDLKIVLAPVGSPVRQQVVKSNRSRDFSYHRRA